MREVNTDEIKGLRKEARDLKEVVAEQALELRLFKKCSSPLIDCFAIKLPINGWRRRRMRYPVSEKLEIIRLVEQSHLSAKQTLDRLGDFCPRFSANVVFNCSKRKSEPKTKARFGIRPKEDR